VTTGAFRRRATRVHDGRRKGNDPVVVASVPDDDASGGAPPNGSIERGYLVLLSVPLAWGTFEPAVRYVYDVAPEVPTLVFSVAYYAVAVAGLVLLPLLLREEKAPPPGAATPPMDHVSLRGGIELGTYLFLGNACQVFGLRTTPSDRAAFLLQLTTIFVPLTQALLSGRFSTISGRVWSASLLALAGVAVISLDGGAAAASSLSLEGMAFSSGDLLILAGAVLYTFHCIRLEVYAKTTSAARLALTKASTEMTLSILAAVGLVFYSELAPASDAGDFSILAGGAAAGDAIKSFVLGFAEQVQTEGGTALLGAGVATTWIGLVTVAYTIYAQSFGQRYIPAATANLIYTTQPLYTAFFAWLLLGETLGPLGYAGGVIILLAVLLVSTDSDSDKAR
jgi:drug/metabolite transporter (DMT)-like permease